MNTEDNNFGLDWLDSTSSRSNTQENGKKHLPKTRGPSLSKEATKALVKKLEGAVAQKDKTQVQEIMRTGLLLPHNMGGTRTPQFLLNYFDPDIIVMCDQPHLKWMDVWEPYSRWGADEKSQNAFEFCLKKYVQNPTKLNIAELYAHMMTRMVSATRPHYEQYLKILDKHCPLAGAEVYAQTFPDPHNPSAKPKKHENSYWDAVVAEPNEYLLERVLQHNPPTHMIAKAWMHWLTQIKHKEYTTTHHLRHLRAMLTKHEPIRVAWAQALNELQQQRRACDEHYHTHYGHIQRVEELGKTCVGVIDAHAHALDSTQPYYNDPPEYWSLLGWPVWKQFQIYAEKEMYWQQWPDRAHNDAHNQDKPPSHTATSLTEELLLGAHPLLLEMVKHSDTCQDILTLLRDPYTAQKFVKNRDAFARACQMIETNASIADWRDNYGNTLGHYLIIGRSSKTVSRAMLDTLLRLVPQWFEAVNDQGHTLHALIAFDKCTSASTLAYLEKHVLKKSVRSCTPVAKRAVQKKRRM